MKNEVPKWQKLEKTIEKRTKDEAVKITKIEKQKQPLLTKKQTKESDRTKKAQEIQAASAVPASTSTSDDIKKAVVHNSFCKFILA